MTPAEHEEHIGYARATLLLEEATRITDGAPTVQPFDAIARWADAALSLLDEADKLLADTGPRGRGAALAQAYRVTQGLETAAQLRERASAISYGHAEASAITGGLVEEVGA